MNEVEALKEKCAAFNRTCKHLAEEIVIAHSDKK
jgi:hypothetical protein